MLSCNEKGQNRKSNAYACSPQLTTTGKLSTSTCAGLVIRGRLQGDNDKSSCQASETLPASGLDCTNARIGIEIHTFFFENLSNRLPRARIPRGFCKEIVVKESQKVREEFVLVHHIQSSICSVRTVEIFNSVGCTEHSRSSIAVKLEAGADNAAGLWEESFVC
jgi:hypothetical protein